LRYLGADYKFLTRMYIDGVISSDGTLYGNLIIRGYGDPSHSSFFTNSPDAVFKYFINILDSLGITGIDGMIIGDDNFFDDSYYPDGWQVNDLIYAYSSQVNALSAYDNAVKLSVKSGKFEGDLSQITIEPDIPYCQFNNYCTTTAPNSEQNIKVHRQEGTNIIIVSGNIPYDPNQKNEFKISVTIDNPTLWFLSNFKHLLTEMNINHYGALLDIDDINELPDYSVLEEFYTYYSQNLSDLIITINKQSLNLASEMLLKTIARETSGYGSTSNGIQQINKFTKRLGIESGTEKITDGSGLSRLNICSPKSITNLLGSMYKSEYGSLFQNSLAVPGEEGTLKKRLTKTLAQNKIHAKTGTLNFVSTLAGYTYTRDNEPIAFSMMFLNFNTNINSIQNIQDLIALRITAFTKNPIKE
jgi:PBP4 family serine-type D-alanyl-D-alanine carboxypeptidase